MRDLSAKGVTRRYAPLWTSIAIAFAGGVISVRDHIVGGNGSVRSRLESWARREISFSRSECIYGWTAAYRQTWTHIEVRVDLDWDAAITAATRTNRRNTWENTIEVRWSDQFGAGRSGELPCPFTFDVQWVNGGQHHDVHVHSANVHENKSNWDSATSRAVASHEFGHMLGHVDEYSDSDCPSRSPINTGTIMDNNTANIPERMYDQFAEELGSNVVTL